MHVAVTGPIDAEQVVVFEQLDDLDVGRFLTLPWPVGTLHRATWNEARGVGVLPLVGEEVEIQVPLVVGQVKGFAVPGDLLNAGHWPASIKSNSTCLTAETVGPDTVWMP